MSGFVDPANDSSISSSVIRGVLNKAAPAGASVAYFGVTTPTGWVMGNGATIGGASSGATQRANADTEDLFSFLWSNFTNTELTIQNSSGADTTRGLTASADFAANKRMPTPNTNTAIFRGQQIFTSSGTWTRPTGVSAVMIEAIGAGGAGGTSSGGGNQYQCGSGGGGAYVIKLVTSGIEASVAVTVGVGLDSIFGSHLTAAKGADGQGNATLIHGAGGVASGGDISVDGRSGSTAGGGGNSGLGYGFGAIALLAAGPGSSGTGYGAGGSGAYGDINYRAGGAGTGGIVVVSQYSRLLFKL